MLSDISQLGLGAGASVASGLRLYGTVAALGFLHRMGALRLPEQLQVLAQTPILVLATTLFVVEFLADKIPLVDTVWDAVHTFIRVPVAAVLAFGLFQDVAEPWRAGAALLCGSIAFAAHGLKASTRLALNTSPEPFTNWAASLSEDVLLGVLIWLAVAHPGVALAVALAVLVAGLLLASWLYRSFKRLFARARGGAGASGPAGTLRNSR